MSNEAKRHHYIPQFILRNFTDTNGKIYYWDMENNKLKKAKIRDIFMNLNMYRDEINHDDNPTYIEKSLSIFENDIAKLIKEKFLNTSIIKITRKELESLRIYLELQSFRDDYRKKQYANGNFDSSTKEILLKYAPDGDFENLWKKEIEAISKCRTIEEIRNSKIIDPIIKQDFINLMMGQYMTIVDARGEDFLLSDVYPTLEIFPISNGINLHLHFIYPISMNRAILLNHIMFKKGYAQDEPFRTIKSISKFNNNMLTEPKNIYKTSGILSLDDIYIYKPQKIYEKDVLYINALILNEAKVGIGFKNKSRVIHSIKDYSARDNVKNNYKMLLAELEN